MKDVLENPANDHDFVLNTLREFFVTEAYNDRQGYDWLLSSILGSHQSSMEYLISKTLLTAHQRFSALNSCVGRNEVTMALYWFKVKGVGWVSPDGTRNCLETAIRRKFYEMIEAILMNEGPVVSLFSFLFPFPPAKTFNLFRVGFRPRGSPCSTSFCTRRTSRP